MTVSIFFNNWRGLSILAGMLFRLTLLCSCRQCPLAAAITLTVRCTLLGQPPKPQTLPLRCAAPQSRSLSVLSILCSLLADLCAALALESCTCQSTTEHLSDQLRNGRCHRLPKVPQSYNLSCRWQNHLTLKTLEEVITLDKLFVASFNHCLSDHTLQKVLQDTLDTSFLYPANFGLKLGVRRPVE